MREKFSEAEFIEMFERYGPAQMSRLTGCQVRNIYARRDRIEARTGRQIVGPNSTTRQKIDHPGRLRMDVPDGVVLIGSDAHYWPGIVSTAHRAFVKTCETFCPAIVVLNGDVFDGASVSRHPRIGWEDQPSVIEEIEACRERLGEIVKAAPNARHVWTLGNHDARFETRLANVAPEYAKVHGVHLKDHFPDWLPGWSLWINDDVVVKHRFKGGIHATQNNTIWAGKTMVTGHLHSLKVTPFSDYNGTRYGVDTGTLAEPYGPQFADYTEDAPRNHRSGFAVLTFRNGRLLWPEVVHVVKPGVVEFRGKTWNV